MRVLENGGKERRRGVGYLIQSNIMSPGLTLVFNFFLVSSYIEERLWWPIAKPQQRKKEESERLREKRAQIKFIDL